MDLSPSSGSQAAMAGLRATDAGFVPLGGSRSSQAMRSRYVRRARLRIRRHR
jgi:hypothetical protein